MRACEFTVKHRLADLTATLLDYIKFCGWMPLRACILVAILYNRPEMLDWLLENTSFTGNPDTPPVEIIKQMLCISCEVLKRVECKDLMLKHNLFGRQDHSTVEQQINVLLGLLDEDNFYEDFIDEIIAALKEIPNVQHECIVILSRKVHSIAIKHNVVKTVLELGPEHFGQDFVTQILAQYSKDTRKILQLLICANVENQDDTATVEVGLKSDLTRSAVWNISNEVVYFADVIQRGVFTHEDHDLAMNFTSPLLMECGFRASKQSLKNFLTELRPSTDRKIECLREYIHNYPDNPRRLTTMCRDAIRKHFRGQIKFKNEFL